LTDAGEPKYFAEAMKGDDSIKSELTMEDEINSFQKNKTSSLTKLPKGKKVLQNSWVYRLKEKLDGNKRYKSRVVGKGFTRNNELIYWANWANTRNFHLMQEVGDDGIERQKIIQILSSALSTEEKFKRRKSIT